MHNTQIDVSQNIEPFLYNILTNPDYKPSSAEFFHVSFDIYSLTTLNPQSKYSRDDTDENPYNNQFERVFNLLLDLSYNQKEHIKEDENSLYHQLYSIKQRTKVINHIFRYLNKKRKSFIINANQCKIGQQISFLFFKIFEENFDKLINKSIESIEPIFIKGEQKKADFTYLINLNYICLSASKAADSSIENPLDDNSIDNNKIYEKYGHQKIIDALTNLFKSKSANLRKELLPEIVEQFYNFTNKIKNPNTKVSIYNNLYQMIIKNLVDQCVFEIMNQSALKMIENQNKFSSELRYVNVLSFHDSTVHYAQEFFQKFEDEFCQKLSQETKVKELANDLINFLDYIDKFTNQYTYINNYDIDVISFKEFATAETRTKFKNLQLNKKFGDKFSIAFSFIIDHFMKKGDNLSSNQNILIDLNKMIQLLSYVTDRDIFISHHTNYMFYRIVTRSTKSIKYEKDFLQKVSNFVQNHTSLKNAFDIIEQAENEEFESLNKQKFAYYIIKRSLAPSDRKYPSLPLPKDYKQFIDLIESKLLNKHKGRKYEWIHYLSTVNVRLQRGKGFSLVTMSLGQLIIFTALSKHSNLSLKDLNEITNIDEDYIQVIIKSFRNTKFITTKFNDEGSQNSFQNATFSLDESFAPRQQVNLCDNWTQQYVPQQKNLDAQRKKSVQAAIVQIMKKYKRLNTQQLVNQTIEKVSRLYAATEEDVMTCIRELVADEYLEESEGGAEMSYIE